VKHKKNFESGITSGIGNIGVGAQAYSQSVLDAIRQGNVLAETFPTQKLQQISSVFTPLLTGAPYYSQPTPPLMTSPGLAAAQAFGTGFGAITGGGQQRNLAQGFIPQQQPQQFGIGSLYGYA